MKHSDINKLFDISNTTSLVYQALAEDIYTPVEDIEEQGVTFILDASYLAAFSISRFERLIRRIVSTKDDGFDVGYRHGFQRILKTRTLGHEYKNLQNIQSNREVVLFLGTKQMNPYLDLLLNVWPTIGELTWHYFMPHEVMPNGLLAAEGFNQSLRDLRRYVQRDEFKKRCELWFTQSSNSFRSTKTYIDHLFSKYARLLVMRLDFGFRVGSDLRSDLLECRNCFKRLLNNQDHNSLFDNQVGYIWRLEFGEKKGWHYHCLFFFDGSKSRQDVTIADAIGEYWQKVITKKQGTYWNCNRYKEHYELFKTLGVGMVHYDDDLKRENLLQAATYLCKIDHYLRQLTPEGMGGIRTFGRGEISQEHSKQGRPRQV